MRMVESEVWHVFALDERRRRLINAPQPETLLKQVIAEAKAAACNDSISLTWQESIEPNRSGYFRLVAQVPLNETTFDQLFNGRSGYRAQYYLSPEEGILYNRDILHGLRPAIRTAYERRSVEIEFDFIDRSMNAPHSKIWVYDETSAFDAAAENTLNPPRWVANKATHGRKAPLPSHCMIDVKGTFIHPATGKLFIDEYKLDRAWDIYNRGYT